jgi:Protein of unknown function (DUF4038)/Putative collagen-binding domain of a collagenase
MNGAHDVNGGGYPVAIGPGNRYLVDARGEPVLIIGDAAWSLIVGATREGVAAYLDDDAAKGFNAILVNLLEAYFAPDPPRNLFGEAPFTVAGDFSTPNETYFEYVDWVLGEAARRGILVFLVPTYLGHRNPHGYAETYGHHAEGWYDEVIANGVEGCLEFGRFLGRRYGRFDNIIWTMGGDRDPGDALEHTRAMVRGIQEFDHRHLFTAHVQPEGTPSVEYHDDPWLAVDFTYSYQILHQALLRDYLRTPTRPNLMIESTYEFDHNASGVQIRRQAYWSLLCGAAGQFMGGLGLFDFAPGWEGRLDSDGRRAIAHLASLFREYPWYDLVPDLSRSKEYSSWRDPSLRPFITSGVGELRGLDFCSAARTPDGRLAIVYMPTAREITVDVSQMAGPLVDATWFDPISGVRRPGGLWRTSELAVLTPPAPQDWALVLQSVAD